MSLLIINSRDTRKTEFCNSTKLWYHLGMKAKHNKVLKSIFETPVNASIIWKDIESLFIGLGAEVSEGRGSRVRVALNGVRAVFHRPHPKKESDKGAVVSVRRLLKAAGVKPC